jgi:alpha-D-ribose 1-methylphosphonate 5-triphosphate diphosphatase
MNAYTLANAAIVGPDRVFAGWVRVEDGLIVDVQAKTTTDLQALDMEGDFLLPGLVEPHTDHLESTMVPRPGVLWPTAVSSLMAHDAQMVCSGVTTVLNALCCGQFHESSLRHVILGRCVEALGSAKVQKVLRAEHYMHLRCELADPQMPSFFEPHAKDDLVRLVSLMDHTPGQRQFSDPKAYRDFFRGKTRWTDKEFEAALPGLIEDQRRYAVNHKDQVVSHCRGRAIPMASHDDATVDHVDQAKTDGVSICEFPTTVAAARRAREKGLSILMGSPNVVRGGSHTGNISALELAELGLLDMLSSDYAPMSLLHGVFVLHENGLPLPRAVAMASATPAKVLGFNDRGNIEPGKRADLLRVSRVCGVPVVRGVWRSGWRLV